MSLQYVNSFLMASTVMIGLTVIPIAVLGISSCASVVRRRGDNARSGVSWLIAAFPFAFLAALFTVVVNALSMTLMSSFAVSFNYTAFREASVRLGSLSALLQRVADILIVVATVEFCGGFLYALSGGKSTVRNVLRIFAWIMGGILIVLTIAWFGVYNAAYSGRFLGSLTSREYARQIRIAAQLSGATDVIMFVISIPLIAYAATVVHKYRHIAAARQAPVLLLVTTVLGFVRWLYYLIFDAIFVLPDPLETVDLFLGNFIYVVEAIFNNWIFLIILVLFYVMVSKKAGGLWSTAQPWTAAVPAGYAQYPQQQQQQPAYQYGPAPHQNGFSPAPQQMMQQPYVHQQGPYQPAPYQPPTQPHVQG